MNGIRDPIVIREKDVGRILEYIKSSNETVMFYRAELASSEGDLISPEENPVVTYWPNSRRGQSMGLHIWSNTISRVSLYHFEDILLDNYGLDPKGLPLVQFGLECDLICVVTELKDLEKFSLESSCSPAYESAIINSFHGVVSNALGQLPPNLIRSQGNGSLACWEIQNEELQTITDFCVNGTRKIHDKWRIIRHSPHFELGAPKEVATTVALGQAAKLSAEHGYCGGPVYFAKKMCKICPPGGIFIDKSIPNLDPELTQNEVSEIMPNSKQFCVWHLIQD